MLIKEVVHTRKYNEILSLVAQSQSEAFTRSNNDFAMLETGARAKLLYFTSTLARQSIDQEFE